MYFGVRMYIWSLDSCFFMCRVTTVVCGAVDLSTNVAPERVVGMPRAIHEVVDAALVVVFVFQGRKYLQSFYDCTMPG